MKTALAYVACAVIWGTTWFAIRRCIGEGAYPTYLAAALRFTIAAAILGTMVASGLARPGPRSRREWAWTIAAGLLNAVGYGLVYAAEARITGGLSSVIYGTAPLMMAVAAPLAGVERPTVASVVGALIAFAGIGVIFVDRLDVSLYEALGVAMMLGSVFTSTLYNLIFKRHAGEQHPLATNAIFLGTTTVAMWALVLVAERRPPPLPPPAGPTIALLYLGVVGSVVAFACYFYLLKRVRLMTVTTLVFIQPIIALGIDAAWEAQQIGLRTYVGSAITLGGVLVSVVLAGAARRGSGYQEPPAGSSPGLGTCSEPDPASTLSRSSRRCASSRE